MARRNPAQLSLRLSPIKISELFSTHWITNRLPLEPEWNELQQTAHYALDRLAQLWREQRNRLEQYQNEQSLEQAFIQPVLQVLGWKLIYQTYLRGRRPDYALFATDRDLDAGLQAGRNNEDFWKHATLLADAKAWHVSLDRPTITAQQREYPPEQIEWYLRNSPVEYAILTNGRVWRLIPQRHDSGQPRFQTYVECDLATILDERASQPDRLFNVWSGFDDFLRFFLFFSPVGYAATTERPSLIVRARTGSSVYRVGVGTGLKERVFEALRLCIQGFLSYAPNALDPAKHLEECRFNSLVLLYRLLFILYAEDRQLLPCGTDRAYTQNRSLGRFRDEIAFKLDRIEDGRDHDYGADEIGLWTDLTALFLLIDEGAARYNVPPYNGGLFESQAHPFLQEKSLPDSYLARIIDQLGRANDTAHGGTDLVRVDYRDLAIQHLGNLYEGLLELQPHFAREDMIVIRSKETDEEQTVSARSPVPRGLEPTGIRYTQGTVYLTSHKGERRASGSYYTPNNIVDYIVEKTIGPLCEDLDRRLRAEILGLEGELAGTQGTLAASVKKEIERLKGAFAERVLKIKILDPAMGSGHFLIRACQFVAEQIATNPHTNDPVAESLHGDESVLTYWKRRVAEACLFGVDRNFMAVELAKLALWLETIAVSQPLTFLDHHFRHGDSLVGASFSDLRSLPDAPPMFADLFEKQLSGTLPRLLTTLSEIQLLPSSSVQQVKQKGKLFRERCEFIRKPFRALGDVWCSTLFLDEKQRVTLPEYGSLVERLSKPNSFATAMEQEQRVSEAHEFSRQNVVPFHWELEFPEAFYTANGPRTDAGFEVIIGNPPYDVLSEKETGRDLSGLKAFLKRAKIYQPSFIGKNNLYKLFLCRSLSLLCDGGRLGFITPMALLGDEQAIGIRREVFHAGTFTAIEAFPQKDDPSRRVFRDAKLSTVISIIRRTSSDDLRNQPFTSRVHPANVIAEDSPALRAAATDVPLYDPSNLTLVSCSQTDWELATRIMGSNRFQRLGSVCTSYQGEVNESNDKKLLSTAPGHGPLVLRGSNVSMYLLREASQGESLYLEESVFLKGKDINSKAHQSREKRIGFQRSSPQNNFRRIVACPIPENQFCFDTISYVPFSACHLSPLTLLGLLNSQLLDWYFRLGSTNSKVNEYQFDNLPCPIFSSTIKLKERSEIIRALERGQLDTASRLIAPALRNGAFSDGISDAISCAVAQIIRIEEARGEISRRERAILSPDSQPYQDFIDHLLFSMAGLSRQESAELTDRLGRMM